MRQANGAGGTASFGFLFALSLTALPLAAQTIDPLHQAVELHQAGRFREALRLYRQIAAANATKDPGEAAAALNNACVLQQGLGDFRAALPDCEEALRLRRIDGDPLSVGETLNNLGLTLEALGRTGAAERLYREALAINRKLGEAESEAMNLGNLAAIALQKGRYSDAMRLSTEAADLAASHRDAPWAAEQGEIARINQGVVLEAVGAYREALDLYKGLLAGKDGSDRLDPRRRAALLANAGVLYRNLGDPVSAVEAFQEAVATYRALGDTAGLSNAQLNLGLAFHLNLARPREAEAAYREALRLAEASGNKIEEVEDLFYLGRLLLAQGRLDEAEAVFRRCLDEAAKNGSAAGRWSAREGLGRIAAARGGLPSALAHLGEALNEIERVRAGLDQRAWRTGYFGDKRSVYAATVDVLWRLAQRRPQEDFAARALDVVQRAKARDLLDALGPGRGPLAPARADEIQARAGDATLLEYFLSENHLYRWTIRRSGLQMTDLGPKAPLLADVLRVHRELAKGAEPDATAVDRLSRALLGNAGPLGEEGERLVIAPDGLLHYLPFEILAAPGTPGVPLIEHQAVSYLPSASMRKTGDAPPSPALRLAGFGAPQPLRSPGLLPSVGATLVVAQPLPAAERELKAIGSLLGGESEIHTGEKATERAFRQVFARGARVIHFATHTIVDERPGGGAAILLSAEGGDDGLLHPREIAALEGHCDLAVLAACSTSLGNGEEGGALVSLTGSFLAAGAPAVVATLWDVGDAATAVFMEQLYAQLGRGLPPDEALRQAKLRLRADPRWSRPGLWAGYVLVGEAPPVAPRRVFWWLGAAGLMLAGLAGLAVSSRRPRGRVE